VIVALDLDGAFSLERIVAYLKKKPAVAEGDVNVQKAAKFLASVQGVRLGIRLSNPPMCIRAGSRITSRKWKIHLKILSIIFVAAE